MINSFRLDIKDDQRLHAWNLVKRINFGNRSSGANGDPEMQYTGVLGEVVFADLMGLPRPSGGGFDYGIDFQILGVNIDMKTMGRDCFVRENFVNNLICSQVDYYQSETDAYLFASINKTIKVLEILGWCRKSDIQRQHNGIKKFLKGETRKRADRTTFETRSDMYEIPVKSLIPFVSPDCFIMEIGKMCKIS